MLKIYLVLLLISSSISFANDLLKEKAQGCTIPLFNKKKPTCASAKSQKKPLPIINKSKKRLQPLPTHDAKKELSLILYEYQSKDNKKDKEIKKRLNRITLEFIKENSVEPRSIKKVKPKIKRKAPKSNIRIKPLKIHKKISTVKRVVLPNVSHLPWVEIVTDDNLNIYQLAQLYYGDKKKYLYIYAANQNLIGSDYKIEDGITLKIPTIEEFKEQPMFLNTD